ncbi:hypothetical protein Mettu_4082 [Methylobacter tundripaludum SV96]|uniref:Uncharacterized protein n=1 Tax=Methylobacter tundripaludum (strain ATCC BAA-1195 / DSM 17260 / SV96) TaxID=697282 RepID=G3J157_METTV|nr:hypothetical protein Mettu_4082 [Methylobacter tundripaludum SV96]
MVSLVFQLGFVRKAVKSSLQQDDFATDKALCLNVLKKIAQGDFSSFSEINDVDAHIQSLRNELDK